ncbi:hypothetical protein LNKW23_02070 [Paralimibaculum aggregatum]|uniref:Uncharacterized protein n=1 Tax=Paralimibaculum aggregatum TaxID=3036245 RepID=A0ABQ6LL44_9RHOB|nr:hypothetical protein LNKW23_02070 [Limibaculum sp. NKW23]
MVAPSPALGERRPLRRATMPGQSGGRTIYAMKRRNPVRPGAESPGGMAVANTRTPTILADRTERHLVQGIDAAPGSGHLQTGAQVVSPLAVTGIARRMSGQDAREGPVGPEPAPRVSHHPVPERMAAPASAQPGPGSARSRTRREGAGSIRSVLAGGWYRLPGLNGGPLDPQV